jgi:enoyl-[acyl-carrier protein] reductase II
VRFEAWSSIMPAGGGYDVVPRVIRTEFVARWEAQPDEARERAEELSGEIMGSVRQGRQHEVTPFTGQTAGLIHELLPAGEIVRRMVREAEEALAAAQELLG